jgi:hypothetical protein
MNKDLGHHGPEVWGGRGARNELRALFTRRLNEELERRKWTLATLLREATPHLPEGFKLSHSHLWHYLRGKALPHFEVRRALSQALGSDLEQPEAPMPTALISDVLSTEEARKTGLLLEDLGSDRARLRLDEELPWPVVLRIVELIRGDGARGD